MKNISFKMIVTILFFGLFTLSSCKKDDEFRFENLSLEEIISNENRFSSEDIEASNSNGYTLRACDIIIYKTNSNHYGKLKILDFDDSENKKLTIKAISFNDDGSIFSQTDQLEIRGTYTCNLDLMVESGPDVDFHWQRVNETDTNFSPRGNALFSIY